MDSASKYESQKRSRYSSSDDYEWVEKTSTKTSKHDEWMSMSGQLKTYTSADKKEKKEKKKKQHIDSYNPSTSVRELNPYWKNSGSGLPQTAEEFRKSKALIKPKDNEDYYSRSTEKKRHSYDSHDYRDSRDSSNFKNSRSVIKPREDEDTYYSSKQRNEFASKEKKDKHDEANKSSYRENYSHSRVSNWHKDSKIKEKHKEKSCTYSEKDLKEKEIVSKESDPEKKAVKEMKYLSDEQMNKLASKVIKAEIMGNTKLYEELKEKLELAREYRKQNPQEKYNIEEEGVLLTTMNSKGNVRPLAKPSPGDPRSKSGKRKAETHQGRERTKYFETDDKYNLSQMFEQEKFGATRNDDEAQFANIVAKHKNPNDDLEDIFTEEITKKDTKSDTRERDRAIKEHKRMEKSLDGCEYCLDSRNMLKHLMVGCKDKVYLCLPSSKSLVEGHCVITTIHHSPCVTALDEDVWEEVMDYRKALVRYFASMNQDVVFFESAMGLHKHPHVVVNCVPMPRDVGDVASIYFKKALLECEGDWAVNKKVVDLKGRNIRKGIPKGLPYFWVDFGMDPGFAHVIEDQRAFSRTFAEEIIAGILDLDHSHWKNTKREHGEQQRKKVMEFLETWKRFDTVSKR